MSEVNKLRNFLRNVLWNLHGPSVEMGAQKRNFVQQALKKMVTSFTAPICTGGQRAKDRDKEPASQTNREDATRNHNILFEQGRSPLAETRRGSVGACDSRRPDPAATRDMEDGDLTARRQGGPKAQQEMTEGNSGDEDCNEDDGDDDDCGGDDDDDDDDKHQWRRLNTKPPAHRQPSDPAATLHVYTSVCPEAARNPATSQTKFPRSVPQTKQQCNTSLVRTCNRQRHATFTFTSACFPSPNGTTTNKHAFHRGRAKPQGTATSQSGFCHTVCHRLYTTTQHQASLAPLINPLPNNLPFAWTHANALPTEAAPTRVGQRRSPHGVPQTRYNNVAPVLHQNAHATLV